MTAIGRRQALHALAFAVLTPAALTRAPLRAESRRAIILPDHPMILRRVVERDLGTGEKLIVTREWQCRFQRHGRGISVEGWQTGAWVDAPSRLEPLAAIERQRDAGLLPLLLDDQGLLASDAQPVDQPAVDRAVAAARAMIDRSDRSPRERQDARQFLTRIANGAAETISTTPHDLFFPVRQSGHEAREVLLPGGGMANIAVTLTIETDPATGLLRRMDKRIVTRIDRSEQAARELWELSTLP